MKYKPIIAAIKAIIIADETANGLIETYREYDVEPGVSKTPVCVIGSSMSMSHDLSCLGDTSGARPRVWAVHISLQVLGRSYPTQALLITEVEKLDATQAAIYTALNADTSLTNTVTLSLIDDIRGISRAGGEYFGYEILIIAEKKEG